MNDTFDNLTLSNLENNTSLKSNGNTNEISFDDSIFINTQTLDIIQNNDVQCEVNQKEKSDEYPENCSRNPASDLFLSSFLDASCSETGDIVHEQNSQQPSKSIEKTETLLFSSKPPSASGLKVQERLAGELSEVTAQNQLLQDSKQPQNDSSTVPSLDKLQLSSWGLPSAILSKYKERNVNTMFPWQAECLNNPNILKKHRNLVYSAPTSAGKTLVSEILAIKTVLERHKKVIFILPFVSVVREKMFYFQEIFSECGVRVDGFMGAYNPPGGFQSVQFAVCTIEKANSLINSFLRDSTLDDIGAVVIDEMHLLGDPSRGYLLELLLTKLRYMTLKTGLDLQIIGMSATLPNLPVLAKWLDAELYITDFRPIPLYEWAQINGNIYDSKFTSVRQLKKLAELETDTDYVLQLCLETIRDNCSVLIFCPTKNWCENLAQQISTAFYKLGSGKSDLGLELRHQLRADQIGEVLQQLKYTPVGLDDVLRRTVSFGVAFHHAGLTLDERDVIESGFRNGAIRVLVATSTLSSGVNLPARRVIVRSPLAHGRPLDSLVYRQMIGRAGRMGKDTTGESILVCQKNEEKIARSLMAAQLQPIESCLEGHGKLKRAILEIVASGVASTPRDVDLFTKCTLLAQSDEFADPVNESLKFLLANEFIRLREDQGVEKYHATSLGMACLSSSMPPEDGLDLFAELDKARQCFVLETELHLIYLVTPYSACHQWGSLDWMLFLNLWEKLPKSMRKVGELVGVRDSYIISATRGRQVTSSNVHTLLVHKRFFVALALQDLVNERPLGDVCAKFNCNRGMLQSLQLTASTFAGMVTSFSRQLGWSSVEILVSQFQDRLHFGVSRDLLDLMRLPLLNGKSARALYDGGLQSLVQLANSDVATIENVLGKVVPFETGKMRDGESEYAVRERAKFKNLWITGKEGLTEREAAELLLKSTRDFLTVEMGLKEAKWDNLSDSNASETSLFETSLGEASTLRGVSMFHNNTHEISDVRQQPDPDLSADFVGTSQDDSYMSNDERTPKRKRFRGKENRYHLQIQSSCKKSKMLPQSRDKIQTISVCSDERLVATFSREVMKQEVVALAVACSQIEDKKIIGLTPPESTNREFVCKNRKVDGFAISWGEECVYYLELGKSTECVGLIKDLVNSRKLTVRMFDAKEHIKVLTTCCGVDFKAQIEDPTIGDWLLNPESREKSFPTMVRVYCPGLIHVARICGLGQTSTSPALDVLNSTDSKLKSSVEAFVTYRLTTAVKEKIHDIALDEVFKREMACLRVLSRMEVVGIGVKSDVLTQVVHTLSRAMSRLEKKAYTLAGRRFSMASRREVCKILGLKATTSTKKEILEHSTHPIAEFVLQWRRISCIVTKTIQPLLRSVEKERIHGCYLMHTATGRITMHEPNLQNVAKNFNVMQGSVSCRDCFVAGPDHVLISADYCQLELRVLAHLSGDATLREILHSEGDVFRAVASKWNNINEEEVSEELRQHAKKICYGIIYGMGVKSLSAELEVDENQASTFMDTFKRAYPAVQVYLTRVLEGCREKGFVETISKRRRYLPHIDHKNTTVKGQAERQAINTTIQGSAADIVKIAMVALSEKLQQFGDKTRLVLHLHDELMYEVHESISEGFVSTLRTTMEGCHELSVPFPVKIKTGKSWGQLA